MPQAQPYFFTPLIQTAFTHSGTASPVTALIKGLSLNSEHLMGILLCKYGLSIPPQYKDNGNNQQH